MSTSFTSANMVSTPLMNLEVDKNRRYLAVVATADVTVTLSGGEPFVVVAGTVWSPIPCPINDMTLSGTGTLIIA